MKAATLIVTLGFCLAMAHTTLAQSPTNTPSPTPTNTPTLTNEQRIGLSTIAPPSGNNCWAMPFNPCGPLPWAVPKFATVVLPSPTLMPTLPSPTPVPITVTPSATATPTGAWSSPTPTPVSSILAGIDFGPVATFAAQISNMSGTLSANQFDMLSVDGTPVGMQSTFYQMGSSAGSALGIFGALFALMRQLGTVGSLVAFIFIAMLVILMVKLATLFTPSILSLVRLVLQVIQAIKPF